MQPPHDPRQSQSPQGGPWYPPQQGHGQYPPQGYGQPPQGQYPPQQGYSQPQYGAPQPPPYYPGPPQQPPRKKRGGFGRFLLFGLLGLVALIVLASVAGGGGDRSRATATPAPAAAQVANASPTATAAPAPTSPPKVGEVVKMRNWDVKVVKVERPGKSLGGTFMNAMPVGEWVVLELEMKNTGGQNFGFNGFDFNLRDANNAKITTATDFALAGYNSGRGGSTAAMIPPGGTVKYFVVFDVVNTSGLVLEFQGNPQKIALT